MDSGFSFTSRPSSNHQGKGLCSGVSGRFGLTCPQLGHVTDTPNPAASSGSVKYLWQGRGWKQPLPNCMGCWATWTPPRQILFVFLLNLSSQAVPHLISPPPRVLRAGTTALCCQRATRPPLAFLMPCLRFAGWSNCSLPSSHPTFPPPSPMFAVTTFTPHQRLADFIEKKKKSNSCSDRI